MRTSLLLFISALIANAAQKPNFVILLCDNLGYGDVACFGSTQHRTPHIDRIAAEGMRLTSFYSTSGVCTPSRASLMTASYPRRVGLHMTDPDLHVLRPVSPNGLHPDEITIAEVLKEAGYATACIGKWHLGDQLPFLPTRQGFDYYYGIPYSDDMTARPGRNWPPLPLMRGERVVEAPADRNTLTRRYTEEAIRFITANRDRPFSSTSLTLCPAARTALSPAKRSAAKAGTGHTVTPWKRSTGPPERSSKPSNSWS